MTQIPSNAISAALTPIQRQQHDAIRARQIQFAKILQHAEEVNELDDTGVDSIRDEQGRNNQQQSDDHPRHEAEDKVEIDNLNPSASPSTPPKSTPPHLHRLDISA
ncbi:MAG TPA: hypothetical protein VM008_00315 [Phycisphaerae bacterium]|nr:hypothetical protein [Phycisphaerae bacterium]